MNIEKDIKFKNYSTSGSLTGPVIVKNKNQLPFSSTYVGAYSPAVTFTVVGYNLIAPLIITAPAQVIININGTNTQQSPIMISPGSGTITIYAKHNPSSGGLLNANITLTSLGALARTVNCVGLGIVDVAPTYQPADLQISKNIPVFGEIGEVYNSIVTADFVQNDAGDATSLKIQKDGVDLAPGIAASTISLADSGTFGITPIEYRAYVNYAAGPLKNYSPSGTPDGRAALIRSVNAPQAAENGLSSVISELIGELFVFYGQSPVTPTTSLRIRSLPDKMPTTQALAAPFILTAGPAMLDFAVAIPSAYTLFRVYDLSTGGTNITGNYTFSSFNVDDAAGNPNSYNIYTYTRVTPYGVPHQHEIHIQ